MIWPDSDSTRQGIAWLAVVVGCLALAGCGHRGGYSLARMRGGSETPGTLPSGSRTARPTTDRAAIELAGSVSAGLNRDPFIGPSRPAVLAGSIDESGDRHLFERLVADEGADPGARPPHWSADPLAHAPAAPSIAPDPRKAFDRLARREPFAMASAIRGPGSRPLEARAPGAAHRDLPALEELAPSPDAAESHLSLIADSAPAPRRVYGPTVPDFSSAPPHSNVEPDFLAVDVQPRTDVSPPSRSAMLRGPDLQRVTANRGGLIALAGPPAPSPPEFITSGPSERDPPEVLPELRIDLDEPPPAPSAPEVGGPWGPNTDRALLGGGRQGDQSPRTLQAIDFSDDAGPSGGSSLVRFRGPLVILFGLLLVACAAVAMRRQAAAEAGRIANS